jgi:ankyrin repeat protein
MAASASPRFCSKAGLPSNHRCAWRSCGPHVWFLLTICLVLGQSGEGQTPLWVACAEDQQEMAKFLVDKGADRSSAVGYQERYFFLQQ